MKPSRIRPKFPLVLQEINPIEVYGPALTSKETLATKLCTNIAHLLLTAGYIQIMWVSCIHNLHRHPSIQWFFKEDLSQCLTDSLPAIKSRFAGYINLCGILLYQFYQGYPHLATFLVSIHQLLYILSSHYRPMDDRLC